MITPLKLKVKNEEGMLSGVWVQKQAESLKKEGADGGKQKRLGCKHHSESREKRCKHTPLDQKKEQREEVTQKSKRRTKAKKREAVDHQERQRRASKELAGTEAKKQHNGDQRDLRQMSKGSQWCAAWKRKNQRDRGWGIERQIKPKGQGTKTGGC